MLLAFPELGAGWRSYRSAAFFRRRAGTRPPRAPEKPLIALAQVERPVAEEPEREARAEGAKHPDGAGRPAPEQREMVDCSHPREIERPSRSSDRSMPTPLRPQSVETCTCRLGWDRQIQVAWPSRGKGSGPKDNLQLTSKPSLTQPFLSGNAKTPGTNRGSSPARIDTRPVPQRREQLGQ